MFLEGLSRIAQRVGLAIITSGLGRWATWATATQPGFLTNPPTGTMTYKYEVKFRKVVNLRGSVQKPRN